ncbi:hypothetical protein ANN_07360 [Periplaneta americana]|uniref:Uncharacterized protein n=1 Tax=Periplaneta americana TaxID=6978 RepID=A0ABQ8SYE4_PERAM|nr:hypothetical protein ANN_07360 [Periplaneta americana]
MKKFLGDQCFGSDEEVKSVVHKIGDSEIFGEMRPRIRHSITLHSHYGWVRENLGKTRPRNQPKRGSNPRLNETSDRQASALNRLSHACGLHGKLCAKMKLSQSQETKQLLVARLLTDPELRSGVGSIPAWISSEVFPYCKMNVSPVPWRRGLKGILPGTRVTECALVRVLMGEEIFS